MEDVGAISFSQQFFGSKPQNIPEKHVHPQETPPFPNLQKVYSFI